ncbi:MAG TPA: ABC transporter permease, partial [Gammaproteobacteria bacterium]|nr:ABC transporter permease [Gammaproteobacteria bacterium]
MRTTNRLAEDLRFGLRFLHKHPNYSVTTLATLVATIASVTTMFSLVNQVVLQPLPLPNPEQLVAIEVVDSATGAAQRSESIPFAMYEQWQDAAPAQTDLAWAVIESSVLTETDIGVYSAGHYVSHNFLSVIGTAPLLGRWFTSDDAGEPVIAISFDMWQRDLGGDPAIIDRSISLDKRPYTVVAVMPERYLEPLEPRVRYWRPVDGFARGGVVLGRLPAGATPGDIEGFSEPLQRIVQREAGDYRIRTVPLLDKVLGASRSELLLLLGGVAALFLVAVLNLTNLTFACLHERLHELSTRSALGATRLRLVGQLLVENLTLSVVAALASIPVTAWLLELALS